jgi:hypothetical protein
VALIDDIEWQATRLNALREAEDLAEQVQPHMLPEVRKVYRSVFKSFYALAKKFLKGRIALSAKQVKIPIETLERYFLVLRDQAEVAWSRSLKASGAEKKRLRSEADRLGRLAQSSAASLKIAAESKGRWNDAYAAEHGLSSWTR